MQLQVDAQFFELVSLVLLKVSSGVKNGMFTPHLADIKFLYIIHAALFHILSKQTLGCVMSSRRSRVGLQEVAHLLFRSR